MSRQTLDEINKAKERQLSVLSGGPSVNGNVRVAFDDDPSTTLYAVTRAEFPGVYVLSKVDWDQAATRQNVATADPAEHAAFRSSALGVIIPSGLVVDDGGAIGYCPGLRIEDPLERMKALFGVLRYVAALKANVDN